MTKNVKRENVNDLKPQQWRNSYHSVTFQLSAMQMYLTIKSGPFYTYDTLFNSYLYLPCD